MKNTPRYSHTVFCLAFGAALLANTPCVQAAANAYTWSGATNGNFYNASNWATATGTTPGLVSSDTVVFNGSGNGNTTITLSVYDILNSITFSTASCAAYTFNGSNVNSLIFANNGGITINAGVVNNQVFNNTIQATSAGNIILANNSTAKLTLSGTQTAAALTASNCILAAGGSGNILISGNIVNSEGSTSYNRIFKKNTGTGTVTLSGSNSYRGYTWVVAGTLQFAATQAFYGGNTASWTSSNLVVESGATAAFNVGGTGEFTASHIATIAALGSGSDGFKTGSILGLDTTNAGGSFTYSNAIANTNGGANTLGLSKLGTGTLILDGASTYTGTTTISAGALQIGGGGTTGSLSASSVVVNNGAFIINRSNAVIQGIDFTSGAISGTGSFVQAGSGTTTLNAANAFSGAVNVQNGVLAFTTVAANGSAQALGAGSTVTLGVANTSSGTLRYTGAAGTLAKNIYALGSGLNSIENKGSGLLTLSGSLVKNGTILVLNGGNGGINVTGTISGANDHSDLYITGGTTTLSAVNTYSGPTWVYGGGTLINGVANALPQDTALILGGTDNSNGTFDLHSQNQTVASLSSSGSGIKTVTNNGTGVSTLTITGGGTFDGNITNGSGTTALSVTGGNLALEGVNTYTGATEVTGGTLTVNGSLATNSTVTVTGAALSGSGTVNGTVNGFGATINGNGLTMGVTTLQGSSKLSGYNIASSVAVTGGSTALTGTTKSPLSVGIGATLNNGGTVIGNVVVSGLLNGSGEIDGNLTLTSGTLAQGNGHGIATVTGNFVMNGSSTLVEEVTGKTAGLTYDQVKVSGNVTLAGTLDLTTLTGLSIGDTVILINNNSTGTTSGYFSTILVSGSSYATASNADYTFTVDGTEYLLSYVTNAGGDNQYNDVTLTVVPEPGTWAMVVGGLGLLILMRRGQGPKES